jgi:hypothetical protein
MITQELLIDRLDYNKYTGVFTWKNIKRNTIIKNGDVAGCKTKSGYIHILINKKSYKAHRLAWIFLYGNIPDEMEIDHINGIRDDNKICNLRLATRSQNGFNRKKQCNNTSGYKGVSFNKTTKKWIAQSSYNNKYKFIGRYNTAEEASIAYTEFNKKLRKEFIRV